jgi:hypothetical protein
VTFTSRGGATQWTTVTARGPGGDPTAKIQWTMHHM